jgi:hypothetical protein
MENQNEEESSTSNGVMGKAVFIILPIGIVVVILLVYAWSQT